MKIELTKDQYRNLITTNAIGNGVLGILGDSLADTDYKERSKLMDEVENHLLSYAKEFGCDDLVDEEYYEEKIQPILNDFEEFSLCDGLSSELARRDFKKEHARAEIRRMAKENAGYFGVEMYDYEKKYWDEFDKHGYERLEIVRSSTKK